MGLLQKAYETYDAMAHRAGIVYEGEAEPLAPIGHITVQANIEITLDQNGTFISARTVDKNERKIIIPVTEESAGRTGKAAAECPHPLCDNIKYLLPYNTVEYKCFISNLEKWINFDRSALKLQAILSYVQHHSIVNDLSKAEIIRLDHQGRLRKEDLMVCWIVNGLGEDQNGPCWTDLMLMQSFISYYKAQKSKSTSNLCMISGQTEILAEQHAGGIAPQYGRAKLISSNDSSGFTYRGRFTKAWQAATVGYGASQKAHNALRWLVANQGVIFGGRTILCWNPHGHKIPPVTGPMRRRNGDSERAATPSQYRKQLYEALSGWKTDLPVQEGVVIAAFDAATKGRLAVTYYNELLASDFLERLYYWDASCCWENGAYGIQSPSLYQLVRWAFGTLKNGSVDPDDRILAQQMQRLVACRVNKAPFPLDVERALVEKASNLQIYKKKNLKDTRYFQNELLFVACAAIRKYHYDHLKEEWDMALDKNCSDRSYLFGRLLAVADALENSTYSDEDRRETNAIRMQKAFTLRPMATWDALWDKLRPYQKRLAQSKPGLYRYFQNTIDEILANFSPSDNTLNQKLDDIYLLGFSHQRAYRAEKSAEPETMNEGEE